MAETTELAKVIDKLFWVQLATNRNRSYNITKFLSRNKSNYHAIATLVAIIINGPRVMTNTGLRIKAMR